MRNYLLTLAACLFMLIGFVCSAQSYPSLARVASPGVGAPGDGFSPSFSGNPSGEVPQVAEWTRTAGPDESIVMTGYKFSSFSGVEEGKDTRFLVYATGGVVREARIQRVDGDKAIITLPSDLPSFSEYLIWPGNEAGWGRPIAVNKTEAWWVGPDKATRGATVSVYGRNLARGNQEGASNAYVYLKSLSGSGSQWATVTKVNPYKVDFTLPSSLGNGDYEVWVHNGHGGEYGWSGPVKLTVWDGLQWNNTTFNVKNYGARGDGSSDDRGAINAAINAAKGVAGSTVYFPSGTYAVSGPLNFFANTRWMGEKDGAGKPASTILCRGGYSGGSLIFSASLPTQNNSFENLKMVRNGQGTGSFMVDFQNAVMVQFNNCEIDARQADPLRFRGSTNHIYLNNTTLIGGKDQWGSTLFLDGIRQVFITGCTFKMTNDCTAAITNKALKEVSLIGSRVQDLDFSTSDGSGWGKGRIWSHIGAGGSAYHCYFAENVGTGLGTRQSGPNLPDQNSGEAFLWEGNTPDFKGNATGSSPTTVSFGGGTPSGIAYSLVIVKGKGLGQYRRIVGGAGSSTVTIDRPWEVQPDGSSTILIGPFVEKMVVYKNSLDANGKSYIANNSIDRSSASAGIEPYGGCFEIIGDGNTMQGLRRGISNWAMEHGLGIDPSYFCFFVNNKIYNSRVGLHSATNARRSNEGLGILGATYRGNTIQNTIHAGVYSEVTINNMLIMSSSLYEYNSFSGTPNGFSIGNLNSTDYRVEYGQPAVENYLLYKNNFSGSGPAVTTYLKQILSENKYQGFSPLYKGSYVAPMLEAPLHVIDIKGNAGGGVAKAPFVIKNSGSSSLGWRLSSSASWLSLSATSGTIADEGQSNTVELSANSQGLGSGVYKAYLTATYGSVTDVYTVTLTLGNNTTPNVAPTVNITSPSNGGTFTAPANIDIAASASDGDGSVSKVEFFNGSTKIGEDASAPYSFSWTGVGAGTYSITAKATDNGGLSTNSSSINITVNNPVVSTPPPPPSSNNANPLVSLTSPTNGSTFTAPASLNLAANASDGDGYITKVEFFNGGTKLGEDASAPYTFAWSNVAAGSYSITAKATDDEGGTTTSQAITVTVNNAVVTAPPPASNTGTVPTTLIPFGDAWKYLDNGSNQGTAWRATSFNDGGWKTGNGQLGYGDGDEATVIGYGGNAGNRYITSYFRKAFNIANISQYSGFTISVKRDDGAIVYVNGNEVYRTNLPAGNVDLYTLASNADDDGNTAQTFTLPASAFVTGTNVIAVEVHQSIVNSSDLSFDLELKGTTNGNAAGNSAPVVIPPTPNANPSVNLTSPTNGSSFTAPATLSLAANASDGDGTVTKVEFFNGGTRLGEDASAPYTLSLSNIAAGTYSITAKATDDDGGTATSQTVTVTVNNSVVTTPPATGAAPSTLIPFGSGWKYLDNGSNQGTAWVSPSYNDGGWKTGNGELGYGDGDEATVVGYGGNTSNRYVTTYFRKTISISNVSQYSSFTIGLKRDDGAVVYVNGNEVYRTNLPAGNVGYNQLASNADDDGQTPQIFTLPVSAFVSGNNVIAVEVHQALIHSSDLSFDLELKGTTTANAAAAMRSGGDNNTLALMTDNTNKGIELMTKEELTTKANTLSSYPNPFQQQTKIEFSVAETANTLVQIYTIQGSLVKTLYNTTAEAGKTYRVDFNGSSLAKGIYICRMITGKKQLQTKLTLAR